MGMKCTSCGTAIPLGPETTEETVECPRCHKRYRLRRRAPGTQQVPPRPPPPPPSAGSNREMVASTELRALADAVEQARSDRQVAGGAEIRHPSVASARPVSAYVSHGRTVAGQVPRKHLVKGWVLALLCSLALFGMVCFLALFAICNHLGSSPNAPIIKELLRQLNNPDLQSPALHELVTYKDEALPYARAFVRDKSNGYNARLCAYLVIYEAANPPLSKPSEVARRILEEEPKDWTEW